MKKYVLLLWILIVSSCASTTSKDSAKPLFEVLTVQKDGGASIRFFEILSEEREIKMLLGDNNLKKKIKSEDINTSNFVILNMGEQNTNGNSIEVEKVEEIKDKIIITTKENKSNSKTITEDYLYPYTIVKINSKKQIVIN